MLKNILRVFSLFILLFVTACKYDCKTFVGDNVLTKPQSKSLTKLLSDETVIFRVKSYPKNTEWEVCRGTDGKLFIESKNIIPRSECAMDSQGKVNCNQLK